MPQASSIVTKSKNTQDQVAQGVDGSASSSQVPDCSLATRQPQAKEHFSESRDEFSTSTDVPDSLPVSKAHPQAKDPTGLLYLPQELFDIIFDLAYAQDPSGATLVQRDEWDQKQRCKWRQHCNHVTQPFPDHKVNSFMASKKYFSNATGAYIRNKCWDVKRPSTSIITHFIIYEHGLFYQNLKKAVVRAGSSMESLK